MYFPPELRFEHCYIPGKNGHGKTTLMQRMALQDIQNGAGVTFIDPGGDAVAQLIHHIPANRQNDCIYLDLEHPTPFDILNYESETEKDELVKDLVALALRGVTNAPRAESILTDLFYTLLSVKIPVSFLDAYYFFTNEIRQHEIIAALPDAELARRWRTHFPRPDEQSPILTRLTPLIRNSITKILFGTPNPPLKIADVMNERKILLVNLGGASHAAIEYGSLLFAKIRQEVFRRHKTTPQKRIPHFLFVDEFHKFPNPDTIQDTLTMARKYKLACTLANQSLQHLDPKVKASLGIISNYVIFCVSPEDAYFFKNLRVGFAPDPATIPKYAAIYKIGNQTVYQETPKPLGLSRSTNAEYIKKRTVQMFACNTDALPHTERNGPSTKPEDIQPDPNPPRGVPPHGHKKKGIGFTD